MSLPFMILIGLGMACFIEKTIEFLGAVFLRQLPSTPRLPFVWLGGFFVALALLLPK